MAGPHVGLAWVDPNQEERMRSPQGWEWLVILIIVLLLFGARRLPDVARSVGRSMRILRTEVKDGGQEQPGPDSGHEPADGDDVPGDRAP